MPCTRFLWLASLLIFLLTASSALAETPKKSSGFSKLLAERGFRSDTDIGGGPGSVALDQSKVSLCYYILYLHYDRRTFSWNQMEHLPFGNGRDEPWHNLDQLTLNLRYAANLSAKTKYFVSLGVSECFEKWADRLHDYNYIGGFQYKIGETSQVLIGFAAWDNPVEPFIIPIVGFQWEPNSKPGDPGTGVSATIGYPRTNVNYRFNDRIEASLGIAMDRVMYKLSEDNTARPGGYVELFDVYSGLYLNYTPIEDLTLVFGMRYYTDRSFRLYDRDSGDRTEYQINDGWGGVIKLEYAF
ncbi:MAG: hypothetical protein KKB20_12165 [Proteobacteria bacterium]|nr:hypothetical protein [Pseudomonadota bacterium]